jgi:NTP pyrophosphatase (non-canonical NTP hydrolase)
MEGESRDELQRVMDIQKCIQIVAYPEFDKKDMEYKLLSNTRSLMHEVIEIERELNYKHWKAPIVVDMERLKDEIVDAFIFNINLVNISGMNSEELIERVIKKMSLNVDRQLTGY